MKQRVYSASLSQSQGRLGYSVIFRHPTRRKGSTGKRGLRVRRGLGTRDKAEAEQLREQLNTLLAEPRYHKVAGRAEAQRRFDGRVVDMFYDQMEYEEFDFTALRDDAVPLPRQGPDGYRHVLFLGTTGAGKTTLVRQLIGTDPGEERFPSTSTAKTTIHDTELIFEDGPWRAVVTFVSSSEAREYLSECVSAAVRVAATKDADEATVLRRLLEHVNQRFRFNYVLGNGPKLKTSSSIFDEEDVETGGDAGLYKDDDFGDIDLAATNELLKNAVKQLRELAERLGAQLRAELEAEGEEDRRVIEELFEEELDFLLRDSESFYEITDALMEEIKKRFELLPQGKVTKSREGWPLAWNGEWPVEKRSDFLKAILRFSSNYAQWYGRLLTPLVNGVRVAGPFAPTWAGTQVPKLVLFDGEGLGHNPKASTSISTGLSLRIQEADAVLLVDNAKQPMQAAPLAALRHIVTTGNSGKLILAFTHFDEVEGDNLPNARLKAQHVLDSAENALTAISQDLGLFAERALRRRTSEACFFLANLQKPLKGSGQMEKLTISQLRGLLGSIDQIVERPKPVSATPVYDLMNLSVAIHSAVTAFHEKWQPLLGLTTNPEIAKEHWTRVKALNRRLAAMGVDEYDTLRPVADLRTDLTEQIYSFIQNPVRWEGPEPSDEERQSKYDALADSLNRRVRELSTRRVWRERNNDWDRAYHLSGRGSTFVRANIIGNEIYHVAAPIPDVTPSPDRNQFLRDVVDQVKAAIKEVGATLQ